MLLDNSDSIKFYKMHGLGNDFVIIYSDPEINSHLYQKLINQESNALISKEFISSISNRNCGIGFDQLMVVYQNPAYQNSGLIVTIYNADGSQSGACGNGMRSVAFLLQKLSHNSPTQLSKHHISKPEYNNSKLYNPTTTKGGPKSQFHLLVTQPTPDLSFKTITTTVEKVISNKTAIVSANMGKYLSKTKYLKTNLKYQINCYIDIGNPHLIIVVEDPAHIDMIQAKNLSYNKDLFPEQANISFVILDNDSATVPSYYKPKSKLKSFFPISEHINSSTPLPIIQIKTFERGVGPTLACGSAACAALAGCNALGLVGAKAYIKSEGGELYAEINNGEVILYGDANLVYSGEYDLNGHS